MTEATTAQGIAIARGDGAGPEVFTTIAEVVDFNGPDGSTTIIDASSLDSTHKEKLAGLIDEGKLSLTINYLAGSTGHVALQTDRQAKAKRNFKITFTDAGPATVAFAAYVTQLSVVGGTDQKLTAKVTLEITGAATWA